MKLALAAAGLALALSSQVMAQEHFRLHTAGELARVCSPAAADKHADISIAFCHGVLAGAHGYFQTTVPAADRFVCLPSPDVTRAQVANGFVAWLKARPQYNNDGAVDALFRYAAEAYPCKR